MFNLVKINLFFVLFFLTTAVAFAANPKPLETDSVKVLYVIDSFDNEEVETVMPRAVLDSILQDVDSVYLGHAHSCVCDCAGGDVLFYFYEKGKARAKFYGNRGMSQICNRFTDSLDLVFKLKNARKINALTDSLMKKRK